MATMRPLHEQTLSHAQQATERRPAGSKMQNACNCQIFQFNTHEWGTGNNICESGEKIFHSHVSRALTPRSTSGYLLDRTVEHWSSGQHVSKEVTL